MGEEEGAVLLQQHRKTAGPGSHPGAETFTESLHPLGFGFAHLQHKMTGGWTLQPRLQARKLEQREQ